MPVRKLKIVAKNPEGHRVKGQDVRVELDGEMLDNVVWLDVLARDDHRNG